MDSSLWIFDLKERVPGFLNAMKSLTVPGYYRFSYSGDYFDERRHWNVGSSVYALKVYYTLGVEKNDDVISASRYITSFLHADGTIYDDLIFRKSFVRNAVSSLKNRNVSNLLNEQYKRAESRQCYAALMLYGQLPDTITLRIPRTVREVDSYLARLNWALPWNAGSHFSHLLFFLKLGLQLKVIDSNLFHELSDYAVSWLQRLQHPDTGCWYTGSPPDVFKINGAMKVLVGLDTVDKVSVKYADSLVDLCLKTTKAENACDNFNIVYVLSHLDAALNREYRHDEIKSFALKKLRVYREHYYPERGGFSFLPQQANYNYYGARIGKGLNEPDLHGTAMFLWGITIIAKILGVVDELGLNEQKP